MFPQSYSYALETVSVFNNMKYAMYYSYLPFKTRSDNNSKRSTENVCTHWIHKHNPFHMGKMSLIQFAKRYDLLSCHNLWNCALYRNVCKVSGWTKVLRADSRFKNVWSDESASMHLQYINIILCQIWVIYIIIAVVCLSVCPSVRLSVSLSPRKW